MSHSFCNHIYHIVFSTKTHIQWLNNEIRPRIHAYLGGAIRDQGGIALIIGGVADHVHVLAKLRQDKAISDVIRCIKANSSQWIHKTFARCEDFNWQAGYASFSVSASQVERVRRYIESQEEHHKKISFKEEFIKLLKRHGLEFTEEYLWK